MGWLYEAAETAFTMITVLHESLLHRDTANFRIPKCGRSCRIRDRYDNVRFEWILLGEYTSELFSRLVNVVTIDLRAWMSKVCVFEWAMVVARRLGKLC